MDRIKSLLLAGLFLFSCHYAYAQQTLYLGVLAHQGNQRAVQKWYPLTEYLNKRLPNHIINIVPANLQEMQSMVSRGRLDFILTNSGHFVSMGQNTPLVALASLRNKAEDGLSLNEFGSVLFTQRNRANIKSLQDLQGKTLAAVSREAFGGFKTVIYEMQQIGMQPLNSVNLVFVGFPQDHIAQLVAQGKVDAGIVRTGVLESLHRKGKLDMNMFSIINEQHSPGFPLRHSTRLYPEWPFAALAQVPAALQDQVRKALINMPQDHPAAVHGNYLGWSEIRDYSPVQNVVNAPLQQKKLENWSWQWKIWISQKRIWLIYCLLAGIVVLMLYILRHDISHRYSHR